MWWQPEIVNLYIFPNVSFLLVRDVTQCKISKKCKENLVIRFMPKNFLLIMFVIFFHITGLLETPTFSEKQKKTYSCFWITVQLRAQERIFAVVPTTVQQTNCMWFPKNSSIVFRKCSNLKIVSQPDSTLWLKMENGPSVKIIFFLTFAHSGIWHHSFFLTRQSHSGWNVFKTKTNPNVSAICTFI